MDEITEEDYIKREDIEYKKILMFQLNTIRELQSFVFSGDTMRGNVKNFISAVNTLRSLLIAYIPSDIKRIDISELDAGCNKEKVLKYFNQAEDNFERLMKEMHIKNLLLERFATIEM